MKGPPMPSTPTTAAVSPVDTILGILNSLTAKSAKTHAATAGTGVLGVVAAYVLSVLGSISTPDAVGLGATSGVAVLGSVIAKLYHDRGLGQAAFAAIAIAVHDDQKILTPVLASIEADDPGLKTELSKLGSTLHDHLSGLERDVAARPLLHEIVAEVAKWVTSTAPPPAIFTGPDIISTTSGAVFDQDTAQDTAQVGQRVGWPDDIQSAHPGVQAAHNELVIAPLPPAPAPTPVVGIPGVTGI